MCTDDRTEIQTHGFAAQSFGFKGRLLNHIVGLLSKQIIENQATFIVYIQQGLTLVMSRPLCYSNSGSTYQRANVPVTYIRLMRVSIKYTGMLIN